MLYSGIITRNFIGESIKNQKILNFPFYETRKTAFMLNSMINNFTEFFDKSVNNLYQYFDDYKLLTNSYSNVCTLNENCGLMLGLEQSPVEYLQTGFQMFYVYFKASLTFISKITNKKEKTSIEVQELRESVMKKIDHYKYILKSEAEFESSIRIIIDKSTAMEFAYCLDELRKILI